MSTELAKTLPKLFKAGGEWWLDTVSEEAHFVIYRINLEPIHINQKARDLVVKAIANGANYLELGNILIMTKSISSIEPVNSVKYL